jgi:hypothetical protein
MKLSEQRKLVVLTYLMEKESRTISDIQAEFQFSEEGNFPFEETISDLTKEGSVVLIHSDSILENPDISGWEITESGKIHLSDLVLDKYEEDNRMSFIIKGVIIVIAILAFMMIFPRMFRH